ncbi:MAG: radical SAM protein [bacterium]|nr:radical SAM protein [bacterium]
MKILFVNPPFAKYGGVEGHGGMVAPLNLGYLASYLRQKKPNFEIDILDCEALRLSYEQIKEYLAKFKPDIVAITMPTPAYAHVVRIADLVKNLSDKIWVIVGGPHPTALPKETLAEKNINFAVIGEGEITFLELIETLERDKNNFTGIKGLAYKDAKGNIFENERRELIKDLDSLPFPAKDLLPLHAYYLPPTKRITGGASTNMVTSGGCPFGCSFCLAKTIWGRQTRFRSIKNVVDEIEEDVKKYNIVDFTFHDEFFTVNRPRVLEFCEEIKKRKLNIKWLCQARCGSVDEQMLKAMKEAGCERIGFGFESGDENVLKLMQKNNILSNARESAKLCKKADIKVVGAFILGYPGETRESAKRTIKFAKEIDPDTAAFFIAIPYPGTELFRLALEKRYIKSPIDWKTFAPLSNEKPPMDIPNMTKEELLTLKRKAYRSFYLRPRYIWKKLMQVKNIGDAKSLLWGFNLFRRIS